MIRSLAGVVLVAATAAATLTACDEGTPNQAPHVAASSEFRLGVGNDGEMMVGASDPDGGDVTVAATGLPPGAVLGADGIEWAPDDAGTWMTTLRATDEDGATTTHTVRFESRYPQALEQLVALGDSVASGQGLDREDYLLLDECWRAEDAAYAALVYDDLDWSGGCDLVACSGAETSDMPGQVEQAVAVNPELVTITIGANDLRFDHPEEMLTDEGVFDEAVASARLATLAGGLGDALTRLVSATDSTIVVTTYHNPAAGTPHGIDGCETTCFRAATDEMVDRLAATISGTARRFPDDRVLVADVSDAFDGHGAGNGYGPDGIRAGDGAGPFDFVFDHTTARTTPYCSKGDPDGDPWVSGLDCVHPDGDGSRAYADSILAVVDAA
ncbi:MAG: GDSL-type esterase/lipase family protein [Acidimicrobiia bacterium]